MGAPGRVARRVSGGQHGLLAAVPRDLLAAMHGKALVGSKALGVGVALVAALLLTSAGVWVRAQQEPPAGQTQAAPQPSPDAAAEQGEASASPATTSAGLPDAPDRAAVPSLAVLDAALLALRRDAPADPGVGGPALEHATLALASARAAERAAAAGERDAREAAEASLRARRIAYAALSLAQAQRGRDDARVARNAAARERALAEGALRVATQALAVARENAGARSAAPSPAPGAPETEALDDAAEADEP